jgi:gold/copper resistance efflux system membrane fusion protein
MARKTAFFLLTAGLAAGTALYWLDFARFEILANPVTDLATAQAAQETQAVPPPPRVPVAQVVVRDAAPWTELTGYVSATESVDIRPRVGGFIEAVTVPEGKFVKKGELLFQIDPRPLQAALGRVRAELSQAEAGLIQAEADYARAEELLRRGVASRKTHDDAIANLRLREAEVRRSKAAVEAAELELSYTRIDAPIAGRVDRVLVTTANLVNGGNAGEAPVLTSIVSIDPVHVYFDIDEATYLDLAGRASDGQAIDKLPVEIGLVGDEGFPLKGNLDFVANEVDRGTGTIRARAVVPNPDGRLFPGLFARVKLPLDEPRPAILIGDEAIGQTRVRATCWCFRRTTRPSIARSSLGQSSTTFVWSGPVSMPEKALL